MIERKKPRLDLTRLEWKLTLTTLLAGGYVALWLGLDVPFATVPRPDAPSLTFADAPRIVQSTPVRAKPVRVVRRIRTRSS